MSNAELKKSVSIQTKISAETAEAIDNAVKKYGFGSPYKLVQYLLSSFLRYIDIELREDMGENERRELMKMLEGLENERERVVSVRPCARRKLTMVASVCIYKEERKRGYIAKTSRLEKEGMSTSGSKEAAIKMIMRSLYPKTESKIQDIGRSIGIGSIAEVIEYLAEKENVLREDGRDKEVEGMFEDNQESIHYGNVPKKSTGKERSDE